MVNETLRELTEQYRAVLDMILDDETEDEALLGSLESIEATFEKKAEGCWGVYSEGALRVKALKEEEARLSKRRKSIENRMESLKKYIEGSMIATGKTKFKTDLYSFNIQKNPPSLRIAEDINIVETVPNEFIIFADPQIDKTKVKEAIKNGTEFEWAELVQTEGLRVR